MTFQVIINTVTFLQISLHTELKYLRKNVNNLKKFHVTFNKLVNI